MPSGNQGWERELLALGMVGYVTTGTSYFSVSLPGKAEPHLLKTDLHEVCSQSHSLRTDVNLLRLVEDKHKVCSHLLRTNVKFVHTYWGETWSLLTFVKDRCIACSNYVLLRTDTSLLRFAKDRCVVCSQLLRTDMKFAQTCQEQMCSFFTLVKDRHEVCSDLLRTDMMFPALADGRREWANLPSLKERHEVCDAYSVEMWGGQNPTSAVMCCKQQMSSPFSTHLGAWPFLAQCFALAGWPLPAQSSLLWWVGHILHHPLFSYVE